MSQIKLSGSIVAGPASSSEGVFPGSTMDIPLSTKENPKGYQRATGILRRSVSVASPSWLDLGEPGNTVTQANFLYLRSDGPLSLRLTTDDGLGGDVVAVIVVQGLHITEFNQINYLKTLEVQGNATVEYFMSGQQ